MKFERVAVAAIVVGALAVGGILLFGPRNAPPTGEHALPLAQKITPTGYPFSSLAILRSQRTTDDVLPKNVGSWADKFLPDTVHHLLTSKTDDTWIAANASGGFCLFSTSPQESGGSSVCTEPEPSAKPGTELAGYGSGKISIDVLSDGTPVAGAVEAGFRQVAPNIWMKGRGKVVRHPQHEGDPYAFPLVEPFKSIAILRRPRTTADAAPKIMTDDSSGDLATFRQDQVRYGGGYDGVKTYVTVNTKGEVCFLVDAQAGGAGYGCQPSAQLESGKSVAGIGLQGADGKRLIFLLFADGRLSGEDAKGLTRIGPNIYWAPTN